MIGIPGAVGCRVDWKRADRSIDDWNREYLRRGAYVVRYAQTFGYSTAGDAILVLPTRDKWTVIRAAATNGVDYGILTPGV